MKKINKKLSEILITRAYSTINEWSWYGTSLELLDFLSAHIDFWDTPKQSLLSLKKWPKKLLCRSDTFALFHTFLVVLRESDNQLIVLTTHIVKKVLILYILSLLSLSLLYIRIKNPTSGQGSLGGALIKSWMHGAKNLYIERESSKCIN